jgi:hypothetical protein
VLIGAGKLVGARVGIIMVKRLLSASLLWCCVGCAALAQQGAQRTPEELSLLAADARQLSAVAAADASAIDSISHPNLRVNAPNNRIVARQDFVQAVGGGQIRNEVAERTPESVTITGDIGVVMGRELSLLAAGSEHAVRYGTTKLKRRYTNVYLRENGAWRLLARHANIVSE